MEMSLMDGLWVWKTRSTPSPCEILRTVNEELKPRLLIAITTPSYAWTRSRSPSTTFTCTTTVSPGLKSGTSRVMRAFSSSCVILLMFVILDVHRSCGDQIKSINRPHRTRGEKLIQQPARLGLQAPSGNQVRSATPGALDRLRQPPAVD